jgi:LysR family glycine cleavage system transcriptional activator
MQAALHGAGIAMSHDTLAKDLLDRGDLIAPFAHRPVLSEGYFLQPAPEHGSTPASRAFQTWIENEMAAFQQRA